MLTQNLDSSNANVTAGEKKQGISVGESDVRRKLVALSGDTQAQRVIDGVNRELQGAETQLLFFIFVLCLTPSPFFSKALVPTAFEIIPWKLIFHLCKKSSTEWFTLNLVNKPDTGS